MSRTHVLPGPGQVALIMVSTPPDRFPREPSVIVMPHGGDLEYLKFL
jgi:hypothetical protein